jgi:septum formation inhibitor-activating ATPase MinD
VNRMELDELAEAVNMLPLESTDRIVVDVPNSLARAAKDAFHGHEVTVRHKGAEVEIVRKDDR